MNDLNFVTLEFSFDPIIIFSPKPKNLAEVALAKADASVGSWMTSVQ